MNEPLRTIRHELRGYLNAISLSVEVVGLVSAAEAYDLLGDVVRLSTDAERVAEALVMATEAAETAGGGR